MYITRDPILQDKFFSFSTDRSCGALASFLGIVRDHDEGKRVQKLHYECYPSMAEKMISQLVAQARQRWPIGEIRILHRIGPLEIGDTAVAIAVSAAHRSEAFEACRFLIEGIKKEVPIWKKQYFKDGSQEWVLCGHGAMVGL